MRLDHQANSPRLHHSVASPAQSMGVKPFRLPEKMEYNFHPLKKKCPEILWVHISSVFIRDSPQLHRNRTVHT